MKIFAISDLHLSNSTDKPMDIFGIGWIDHWEKIKSDWINKVTESDAVLIAGDISWAININEAVNDLYEINELPGKKIIIRGNHDYWWSSYKKICDLPLNSIYFIQNNAIKIENYVFCGTRGWEVPEANETQTDENKKIYEREIIRLNLALSEAKKLAKSGEEIIGMIHYPPFNSKFENSPFTELFSEYGVKKVVYGHLHGGQARFKETVNKYQTDYYLTSCDFLQNKLIQLI